MIWEQLRRKSGDGEEFNDASRQVGIPMANGQWDTDEKGDSS